MHQNSTTFLRLNIYRLNIYPCTCILGKNDKKSTSRPKSGKTQSGKDQGMRKIRNRTSWRVLKGSYRGIKGPFKNIFSFVKTLFKYFEWIMDHRLWFMVIWTIEFYKPENDFLIIRTDVLRFCLVDMYSW